jgi:hypothetical protein
MDRTQSAPAMDRPRSVDTSMLERSSTEFPTWYLSAQEPTNGYALFSGSSQQQQQPNLQTISEGTTYPEGRMVEYSPHDFINLMEPLSSPSLPLSLPQHSQHVVQLTHNMQWSPSTSGSASPQTPSTALMTPVTQSSNAMSRQSSLNPHFLDVSSAPSSLLQVPSSSSMLPILAEDSGFSFSSLDPAVSPCVDSSLFLSFTGSASESFLNASYVPSSVSSSSASASANALASSEIEPDLAEDMRRSASNSSATSTASSAGSRASRREREIIVQTSRPLAPKANSHAATTSAPSNAQMAQITSSDGSSKTVGVLTKTPYVRPMHAKIMCVHCNERPDGFRGTHELDRHIARAHAVVRKGYICVAPSFDSKFLDACKHCRNGKVYGAYYNAAAHLRRAHFHPRKRGRKGKNDEKRGGIGGGDDPPMDFLKMHWIQEIEVPNRGGAGRKAAKAAAAAAAESKACEEEVDVSEAMMHQQQAQSQSQSQHPHQHQQQSVDAAAMLDFGLSMHASEPMLFDDGFAFAAPSYPMGQ